METKNKMKALIYDPYLRTMGGGERYVLGVAEALRKINYEIYFAYGRQTTLNRAKRRFGIDTASYKVDPDAYHLFKHKGSIIKKYLLTKKYDFIFFVSDGSIPFLFGKKNFIHFQVPFTKYSIPSLLLLPLKNIFVTRYVYNSLFTKRVVEKRLRTHKSIVVYPPIDIDAFKNSSVKDNIILSVGRFDSPSHSKRFDVLVRAFKLLYKKNKKLNLIIAGGLKGDFGKITLKELKLQAEKYPISFVVNPSHPELIKLYAKSRIYWHAAGYDIDEEISPELVEHFGISTVEAMASGCVPVVINKGGQKEIVTGKSGFLWNAINELVNLTLSVFSDDKLCRKLSRGAIKRSNKFSEKVFAQKLQNL
jgi:glycosyltransferase involved in cell wall biosynthesis